MTNRTPLTDLSRLVAMASVLFLFSILATAADVKFSRYLSDNAIVQRDKPVTIRGTADTGAKVTVTFAGQTKTATADGAGQWSVVLDAMPANTKGSDLVAAAGASKAVTKNVLVGDVILVARQTSVDVSLGRDAKGQSEAGKLSANPAFRVLTIKTIPSTVPLPDLPKDATTGWAVVNKTNALSMSAAAYLVGRDLVKEQKIPVGIVDLNMGRNFTLGWIDAKSIATNDDYYGRKTRITGYAKWQTESLVRYRAQEGKEKPAKARGWVDTDPSTHPLYPAAGYNAVLHPLRGTTFKACLVQLGNDYAYLAYEELKKAGGLFDREKLAPAWWTTYLYRKQAYRAGFEVLPRLPRLWRKYFDDRELPMAFVMPPSSPNNSYATHNHEIREVQRQTAAANPGVGVILPSNDHIPFSGQPADDKLLADRSLAWLRGAVYKKEGQAPCGPLFDRIIVNYNKVQVLFKPGTADGLKATPGALDVFEVAAIDAVWSPAKATIDGKTIRVVSDTVNQIAYVRYNYNKRPHQGLTNAQGLPAIPFRTGEHKWIDVPRNKETNLPKEYTTPASEWENDGVAIISGGGASFGVGSGWIGPAGFKTRPFGPNMRVTQVVPKSPADGKIMIGDMIYKIDGTLLGNDVREHLQIAGQAIARAESDAGAGKITFSLLRGDKLLDVELTIEVLGTCSSTTPYDCPKSDRIVKNSEAYLAARGGVASGTAGGGWLHTDSLFLLAAGTPKYQGLVRRFIYNKMTQLDKIPMGSAGKGTGGWAGSHGALLFGEYYHATGDKNVLPYMEKYAAGLAATQCRPGSFPGDLAPNQVGGWRHNYPGGQGYGMMATIGLPAMIGWKLAMDAGVTVDPAAYARGRRFFTVGQAEMGLNIYAATAGARTAPEPMDPEKMAKGMMGGHNGSRGLAAMYYRLTGDTKIAHLNSMYCVYSFNECSIGHGGNFFNGMWTPVGASVHGKKPFIEFMKKHYWYQDLKRMYNHAYLASDNGEGLGPHLALVAPRQRLRILGAPESPFAATFPPALGPALTAYHARDYAKAVTLATELLAVGELNSTDRDKTEVMIRAAKELQESIEYDLTKAEGLIKEGKLYEASLDVPQLMGVMPGGDARLAKIMTAVADPKSPALRADKSRYDTLIKSLRLNTGGKTAMTEEQEGWQALTTQESGGRRDNGIGTAQGQGATVWRGKVLEGMSQAPAKWAEPDFDDSKWYTGALPFSWHLNHSLIARTTFDLADKNAITALRISTRPFRQLSTVVYINGKIVAKFNQCEGNKGWVHGNLTDSALKHLKTGKNTLAVSTTNDWRWATRSTPDNGGFGLVLKAKTKK